MTHPNSGMTILAFAVRSLFLVFLAIFFALPAASQQTAMAPQFSSPQREHGKALVASWVVPNGSLFLPALTTNQVGSFPVRSRSRT
jgi:hypothetical protein